MAPGAAGGREKPALGAHGAGCSSMGGAPPPTDPGRVGLRSLGTVGVRAGQQGRRSSRRARPRAGRSRRTLLAALRCSPAGVASTLRLSACPSGFVVGPAPGPPRPRPTTPTPPPASAPPRPGRARSAGKRSPGPTPPRRTCGGEALGARRALAAGAHPGFLGHLFRARWVPGSSPRGKQSSESDVHDSDRV
ncbi:TPA: hypothetical protein BOS_13572 [Bos taurus]|nr:TPA: hypothetical protein BOS_13572 [Bos taurus]